MKKGIHFLFGALDSNVDLKQTVARFARVGFDCVELPPDPFLEDDGRLARDMVDYAAGLGVEVVFSCGFHAQHDMASDCAQVRQAGTDYMQRVLDVMERAGVRLLGGTCQTRWPAYRTETLSLAQKAEITERTALCFAKAIRTIEDRGITIAIEPLNRFEGFLINTAAEGAEFCRMVGNPNLGLMLDGFHMSMEEDSIPGAVLAAGAYLKHLHLAENNRKLPGTGSFPWNEFFAALKQVNYRGRLDIESFITPGGPVAASVGLWRDLSQGADQAGEDEMLCRALGFIQGMADRHGLA